MRIWSLHPKYLDQKGLVALWREGLLAKKVLEGGTKGYRNHPQLIRFRELKDPVAGINYYLSHVVKESTSRGYSFDAGKLSPCRAVKAHVTDGQMVHELQHLREKLKLRDPKRKAALPKKEGVEPHPMFRIVPGGIESWEKVSDNPHTFPYGLDFSKTDFRKQPALYRVGKGEQGVLMVEPYKSEILPHWRFRTPEIAEESAKKIYRLFLSYKKEGDFVGMDMARKFLQMGYTRSRRYANHASGKKYETNPQKETNLAKERAARTKVRAQASDWDTSPKAESARIFYGYYLKAREDAAYKKRRAEWLETEKQSTGS